MNDKASSESVRQEANPAARFLIDLGPLVAFVAAFAIAGIYWATGVLMVATLIALAAAWLLQGRVPVVPVVTAVLVAFFGGLTFMLDDPRFIKIKPTAVNLLFAGALSVGLLMGRPLLKLLLGEAIKLTDEGWQKLTARWIGFFVAVAILNEIVWRNYSEGTWVAFKFGILPLTLVFAMAQIGLIRRYEAKASTG
jgi:intracellular septation protein